MRIVMTTFHAGGNVPPFVELGRELVRRGHLVTCLGQPSLQPGFKEAGVAFRPLESGTPYRPFDRVRVADQMGAFAKVFFDDGYGTDLKREVASTGADAVVIDSYLFGAMAAAEAAAIPAVVLVHTLFGFMQSAGQSLLDPINETRSRAGLAHSTATGIWSYFQRLLVTTTPLLDAESAPELSNLRYTGPLFGRRPEMMAPAGEDLRPHILVALSTTYMEQEGPLRSVLDALSGMPVRATMTTGQEVDVKSMSIPDNVTATGWLRHASVMSSASVVITHGGHGTVSTALAQGRPLLCIPLGRDQPYISDRVQSLGAGIRLDPGATPAAIRDGVTTLLRDPSYRLRAEEIASAIRAEGDGCGNAAEEVERLTVSARR